MRIAYAILLSSLLVTLAFFSVNSSLPGIAVGDPRFILTVSASSSENAMIYFLDVGQGDSIFIMIGEKMVLIDGGSKTASSILLEFLDNLNVSHIDYVIASHPHEDHIGGLVSVLQTVTVDVVLYNGYNYTSQTFQDFMNLAQECNLTIAERNQVYPLTATANFTIFNPIQPLEFSDTNSNSIVLKLQINTVSLLLTGDATMDSETSMMNDDLDFQSDLLKVAHHGSYTSSSQAFLDAVKPTYAVISAGLDNPYGHPHNETTRKLIDEGITTYGTYISGTIIFVTDGNTLDVQGNPTVIPEFSFGLVILTIISLTVVIAAFKKSGMGIKKTSRVLSF